MNERKTFYGAVFDGWEVHEAAAVTVENGVITAVARNASEPGEGFLMPGLIDGHLHIKSHSEIEELVKHGVTTACDVCVPEALRRSDRLNIWTSCTMATGDVTDGRAYVEQAVSRGADYIKVILEQPARMASRTMEPAVLREIVRCAHEHGRKVAAHAVTVSMVQMAADAGADILIHVPMREPFPVSLAEQIAGQGMAIVPTLVMMQAFANDLRFVFYQKKDYANAEAAVGLLHSLGVPVLAGTDASNVPFVPKVWHGSSLHRELELLVQAGLTPVEALRGATGKLAEVFGIKSVGTIAPGQRADLVLVDGRPDRAITDNGNIKQVLTGITR